MSDQFHIRAAKIGDLNRIAELCRLHAQYEHASPMAMSSIIGADFKNALGRLLFGTEPSLACLVVQAGDSLEGYATFVQQYSTWQAKRYLYMDCLYLTECARGQGVGRALMNRIRSAAIRMGVEQLQWQTPQDNLAAIRFYERLGAESSPKKRFFWTLGEPGTRACND